MNLGTESPSKYNNPSTRSDERALTGKGQYDLSTVSKSEFEIEEDYAEVVEATENQEELKEVVRNYQRILSGIIEEPEESPLKAP